MVAAAIHAEQEALGWYHVLPQEARDLFDGKAQLCVGHGQIGLEYNGKVQSSMCCKNEEEFSRLKEDLLAAIGASNQRSRRGTRRRIPIRLRKSNEGRPSLVLNVHRVKKIVEQFRLFVFGSKG